MKKTLTLKDIKALHQGGDSEAAKAGYIAYLSEHPHDVDALHLLGLLCAESGDLDAALEHLRSAMSLAFHDVGVKLHMANILKAKGELDEAVSLLEGIISEDSKCAPAFNNLGTIYFAQESYSDAIKAYQAAIDARADYADAYYNLGLAYSKLSMNDEAMAAYEALIDLQPTHPGAHFQLGCIFMSREQIEDAMREFHAIIQAFPHHFESYANLAACYLRQGKLSEAGDYYRQALEVVPDDKEVLFNLGVIAARQGYTQDAIDFYQKAVKSYPDYLDAHNNLAAAYLMRRDHENALHHFQEALRLQPDNEALRHTVRIMKQDKTLKTSAPAYIQSLFDSYADYYEAHLKQHLHYQVPEKLFGMVQHYVDLQKSTLDILDLGCGTGLCGELFKPYARRMIGVDLSENMLAVARQKHIYDDLVTEDASAYLKRGDQEFNLILAGDVLVYFGELDGLLKHIAQALKPGGYFAFNVEISEDEDYSLTSSGRFAHKKSYLDQLAQQFRFQQRHVEAIELRRQRDEAVPGFLCLWQK